ncbi:MAG: NADH:ubiquinone reductase (Na(+)-transporting) subunit C [Bacteroidota bacterium]|nr:NADH:ubiquinone reductase (Na(+)-transporting) subunit C [Bacteroidota bacterium]
MNVEKNSYTFIFATIMVLIVAALLATTAISLKPFQETNVALEKKQNILSSIGVDVDRNIADKEYSKYIIEELVLNNKGEKLDGVAFDIDLAKQLKKEPDDQLLPLFVAKTENGNKYIIPLRGKGLWGPIWGFMALNDDLNTVYGAVFDHKSETPGLGAEINQYELFQKQFEGKEILNGNELVSITVIKGGAPEGDKHGVDGISGGTITSDGVTDMLLERLTMYESYFRNNQLKFVYE